MYFFLFPYHALFFMKFLLVDVPLYTKYIYVLLRKEGAGNLMSAVCCLGT